MSVADRVYQMLLRVYPPRFRRNYEHEMLLFFRDQRRHGAGRGAGFWAALGLDTARSASGLWREQFTDVFNSGETTMKTMALLAAVVGAYELLNLGVELNAGGFASRDVLSQLTLVVVLVAAALLVAGGIALLRRASGAIVLARLAGAAALGAFAFIGIARPVLSPFAMLLGVGFPLALLVFFVIRRGDGVSHPA